MIAIVIFNIFFQLIILFDNNHLIAGNYMVLCIHILCNNQQKDLFDPLIGT